MGRRSWRVSGLGYSPQRVYRTVKSTRSVRLPLKPGERQAAIHHQNGAGGISQFAARQDAYGAANICGSSPALFEQEPAFNQGVILAFAPFRSYRFR